MAKIETLSDVGSLANTIAARAVINANSERIEDAFQNTLSRDGSAPNTMEADIDLNGNYLLNVADPVAEADGVNLRSVRPLVEKFATEIVETAVFGTQVVDPFVAAAGQTEFVLSELPGSVNNVSVFVDGLALRPTEEFALGGTSLQTVFLVAPLAGGEEVVIRYAKSLPTGITQADSVMFVQSGVGMVPRSLQSKGRDIVHADDRGLLGDASDETTEMQDLLIAAQGKVLMLGYGKTYGISSAGITIPANTTLITNGSKFRKLAASATYGIKTLGAIQADALVLEVTGGAFVVDAGVSVAGGNSSIGRISVLALTAGASTGYGVSVGTGVQGSAIANVNIGRIEVDGFRAGIRLFEVDNSRVGYYKVENCEQGLYIRDCEQTVVDGGDVESMWASATGAAGQNGVLIESVAADYACRDIYLNNITVKISGEHGFRLGGSKKLLNIHHDNCASYKAGSGSASVGGSGFKALGGTITTPHEGIYYTNCYVEDAGSSNSNWSGIVVGLCDGVQINNCIVRARTLTHSGFYGIWVDACKSVVVSGCQVHNPNRYALLISAEPAGFVTDSVTVSGGIYRQPATGIGSPFRNVVISANGSNVTNVHLDGLKLIGGEIALSTLTPGGGFSYSECHASFSFRNPSNTLGSPPIVLSNNTDVLVHCDSPFYGTFGPSARDGSIFQDITNGLVKIRKAGVWASL